MNAKHADGGAGGRPAPTAINRLRRGTAIVFAGSVLGYGINYLVTPLIGRLVDPSTFGVYSALLALASLFTGVSTMRLEVFAASITSAAHQQNARRLAVLTALVVSALVSLGCTIAWKATEVSPVLILAGPMVFMGSLQLAAAARYSVDQRYPALGGSNFIQGAGTGVVQLGLAAVCPTTGSLVAGFLIARLHWMAALTNRRTTRMPLAGTWRRARGFALPAGSSALLNSAGGQAPVLLMTAMFGAAEVGVFAMATRLLVGPLAIVAQAVGSTSLGAIGRLVAQKDPQLLPTVDSLIKQLGLLMLVPCALAGVAAPWLVTLLLGPEWEATGKIIQVLAVGAYAQAVGSPLTQVLNLTHNSRSLMRWDAARLAAFIGIFLALPLLGADLLLVTVAYSASLVALYAVALVMILRAVRRLAGSAGL